MLEDSSHTYLSYQQQLAETRQQLTHSTQEVIKSFDLLTHCRSSIRKKPWPWLGGSLITGVLLSKLSNLGFSKKSQATPLKPTHLSPSQPKLLGLSGVPRLVTLLTGETSLLLGILSLGRQLFPLLLPLLEQYQASLLEMISSSKLSKTSKEKQKRAPL